MILNPTARDILTNKQAIIGWAFTVHDTIYTNRDVGVPGVKDRLDGGPTLRTQVGADFSAPVVMSLGAQRIINTNMSPLTDEQKASFKNAPFTYEIFGTMNHRLVDEQVIDFADRLPFISGFTNGKTAGDDSFLVSLGIDNRALSVPLLNESRDAGDELVADDVAFAMVGSSLARNQERVDIDIVVNSLTDSAATIDFNLLDPVTDIELALVATGAGVAHTLFDFEQVSSTEIQTTVGLDITITISNINSSTQTVTIEWLTPLEQMKWLFRSFNPGQATNWSQAPSSSTPTQADPINSELEWLNMGGATSLSFDVLTMPVPGTIVPDSGGRPYMPSIKFWPLEATEAKVPASALSFDVAPTIEPGAAAAGFGDYKWQDVSVPSLTLSATFPGTSGANPLVVSAQDNKVTIGNAEATIEIILTRLFRDSDSDPTKLHLRPLLLGQNLKNVSPVLIDDTRYDLGPNTRTVHKVRNDGVDLGDPAESIFHVIQNHENDIISWYFDAQGFNTIALFDPDAGGFSGGVLWVSGSVGEITVDASSDEHTLEEVLAFATSMAATPLTVDPVIADAAVGHYLNGGKQVNAYDLLNQMLSPIDALFYFWDGLLVVEDRAEVDGEFDQVVYFKSDLGERGDIVPGTLKVGNDLPQYHEYAIGYSRNWTKQQKLPGYKNDGNVVRNENTALKFADHPANLVLSGSQLRTEQTCLMTAGPANRVAGKRLKTELVHFPLEMFLLNRVHEIRLNRRTQIKNSFLPAGTFVPLSVADVPTRKETFLQGVYYVHQD